MEIAHTKLSNGIDLLKLKGRLDIIGTGEIETKFAAYCSGDQSRVVVEMSGVDYLASIGIRLLMINAKSLASRKGKMAIINPSPEVLNVLEIAGITSVIPVYSHMESAEAVLLNS